MAPNEAAEPAHRSAPVSWLPAMRAGGAAIAPHSRLRERLRDHEEDGDEHEHAQEDLGGQVAAERAVVLAAPGEGRRVAGGVDICACEAGHPLAHRHDVAAAE